MITHLLYLMSQLHEVHDIWRPIGVYCVNKSNTHWLAAGLNQWHWRTK